MPEIELLASTGVDWVDRALCGVIEIGHLIFPGRIRTCYVHGSYADGSASRESDIDVGFIFRERILPGERDRIPSLRRALTRLCRIRIDLSATDEACLHAGVPPSIRFALIMYGDPIPDQLPPRSIQQGVVAAMDTAFRYMRLARRVDGILAYPLQYPDPHSEFFGYEKGVDAASQGSHPNTRALVNIVTMNATSLVAQLAGHQVPSKSRSADAYQQHIGDGWSPYVQDVYRLCRTDWDYQIPTDAAGRKLLQKLCAQALDFENDYLRRCKPGLLSLLRDDIDNVALQALSLLQKIRYPDPDIAAAVRALTDRARSDLRERAELWLSTQAAGPLT